MEEQVTMRYKRTGRTRLVDASYAALHLAVRGKLPSCHEARRRLLAGERLETWEAEFYQRPAARGVA